MAAPTREPLAGATFLDPKVLAAIGNLELLARTVVDGFLHGQHRSPKLGLSMEFAQHRQYMPGDDIRKIDWRVYGRTDRFYVKEYEAETNATVTILLDISPSMTYTSGGVSKLDYGRFLAASLAWFSARQRDRIGLILFDDRIVEHVPNSTRHLQTILHVLDRMQPGGKGNLLAPLARVAERLSRRGIVILISDFYEEPDHVRDAVGLLRAGGSDVLAFHLLDPAELRFPFDAAATFEDLESGDQVPIVPEDLRSRYRELVAEHLGALTAHMAATRVDYEVFETSKPLDFALHAYLARRHELRRTR
jgi:uncharacterized protein (DUF58 family)